MPIDLAAPAHLLRVIPLATGDPVEEPVAAGPVRDLVARVLAMPAADADGLVLRIGHADGATDHDLDAVREIAARPEYTGAYGSNDTALRPDDPDRAWSDEGAPAPTGPSGTPADPPARSETGA